MTFTSVEFLFFFPVAFGGYWLLPRRAAWQNAWLLALGAVFYASWSPAMLGLLAATIAVDWGLGLYLEAHPADETPERATVRRRALAASLVWNLGLLVVFKYLGFLAGSLEALLGRLGLPGTLPVLQIALPMGISYFTLQKLSYILDVYYGRMPACRSLPRFATAVAFFPHMVAGPITRFSSFLPQLAEPRRLTPSDAAAGGFLFLLGFFEKACLADNFAQILVDPVFARAGEFTAAAHWMAVLGYTLQVFGDFAGYSLMAMGVARGFGLHLPLNFDRPFLSTSLAELWRRWHITLNTWLFEYIYTPLTTGQGFFRGRLDLGFLVVFLISGLWHGPAWGFVAWGAMHGVGLIVVRRWDEFYRGLCRRDRKWVARRRSRSYKAAAWGLTMLFFMLSLVPFRAGTWATLTAFLRGLVPFHGGEPLNLGAFWLLSVFAVGLGVVAVDHLMGFPKLAPVGRGFLRLPAPVRGVVYGAAIVYLAIFVPQATGLFIYARF